MMAGLHAARFAVAGFTVGFAFIYDPGIMLRGSLMDIILATSIQTAALVLITSSYAGYLLAPFGIVLRVAVGVAGLLAAFVHVVPDGQRLMLSVGLLAGLMAWQRFGAAARRAA
jgi:TRAP-type uncharacterized transport system fused permease subunit